MLYYNADCCDYHAGFKEPHFDQVKVALAAKGVDPGLVDDWFRNRKFR